MTSLFPPFNRRAPFRKLPYFFEAGRGVYYKSTGIASPSLALDFTTGVLDPRITFSRASNATLTDSTGKIIFAPSNLILQSQTFTNASWLKLAAGTGVVPVVTGNYATAPDGTNTASRIQFDLGATPSSATSRVFQTPSATTICINSIWLKTNDGTTKTLYLYGASTTVGDLITVTPDWQRFSSRSITPPYAQIHFGLSGITGGGGVTTSTTADVLAWGAQVEAVTYQTTPSTYKATTTAVYYGPRFDYDPNTLAAKGLLIEEARTNLALYSQQFDDVSWAKQNFGVASAPVVTSNAAIAPDGTTTADRVQFALNGGGTSSDLSQLLQTLTYTAASHTGSIWLRSNTGANQTVLLMVENTQAATLTVTPQWQRFSATKTTVSGSSNFGLRIRGTFTPDTADILVWGAQLEAGAFATSYIPTVAASVARSADIATMTGTNFSSWFNQGPVNLLLQSQTFDNASWTKSASGTGSAPVVTANADLAPDGTMTADLVAFNRGAGNTLSDRSILSQSLSASDNTNVVGSVYLKAATAGDIGKTIAVRTASGGAYVEVTLTANWVRFSNAGTTTVRTLEVESRGTISASNSVSLLIWGAQLEVGSTATTYIPTTTVPVASPPAVGTFVAKADAYSVTAYSPIIVARLSSTAIQNSLDLSANNGTAPVAARFTVRVGSVTQADTFVVVPAMVPNIPYTFASAFATNDFISASQGNLATPDTSGAVPAADILDIGNRNSVERLNGHLQYIKYYPTRLPNAKLQALTV